MNKKRGFTLIELMIVIAIIAILLGATFMLMSVATDAKARAVTVSRIERLQNALAGYYSAYGMYPAVQIYQNPNLNLITSNSDTGDPVAPGSANAATVCSRAQPIAFEYPTPLLLDDAVSDSTYSTKIQSILRDVNAISVNKVVDSLDAQKTSWADNKGFKFGLMSFLLPRVEVVGLPDSPKGPKLPVFVKGQWKDNNPTSKTDVEEYVLGKLITQRGLEEGACKAWLPNLEKTLSPSFKKEVYGIKLATGSGHGLVKRGKQEAEVSANTIYLAQSTVTDGWGREFFYYSAPPHQSYRIWSAGSDGCTFPPWEKLIKSAEAWIKDDIVGGKM